MRAGPVIASEFLGIAAFLTKVVTTFLLLVFAPALAFITSG